MIFLLIFSVFAQAEPVLFSCNGEQRLLPREKNDDTPLRGCDVLYDSRKDGPLNIKQEDIGFVSVAKLANGKKAIIIDRAGRDQEHARLKAVDDDKKARAARLKVLHDKLKAKDLLSVDEQNEMLRLERGL
jgi:hypothetical protein